MDDFAGYAEAYFIKEEGLFSRWHLITTDLCSPEWISETEFELYHDDWQVDHPNYVEGSYNLTRHSVDEFIK